MIKRIVLAGLAGGITYFILGFLIYGMLLEATVMRPNMNQYAGLTKEMPDFVPLMIANLISGLLFAYILDLGGARTFASGAKIGAIVSFLWALSMQLMFLAFWNLLKNYIPFVADIIGATVMGAIVGGVVGIVLGLMSKESDAA